MRIELSTGTPAELVQPSAGAATRGLVLWPDIMGLRPLFDDHCRRLADDNGWVVCAPEMFPGQEDLPLEDRHQAAASFVDASKNADAVAAADATGMDDVGIIGFCMGGMYALKASSTGRFDRVVAFYGMIRLPELWMGDGQSHAIDHVAVRGDTDVMAIVGTVDTWTPSEEVDELEQAGATIVRYEGADHGFVHDPDRPAHRADDAADAWSRALAFLAG